jgi:hypothetical protein
LTWATPYKTYVAAAGLVGLAVYQMSQGQGQDAWHSLMLAGTAVGLRHTVSKLEK